MGRFDRRGRIDIYKDILIEAAPLGVEKGATKSYIMNGAGLGFYQTNSYLKLLTNRKLLKKRKWNIHNHTKRIEIFRSLP